MPMRALSFIGKLLTQGHNATYPRSWSALPKTWRGEILNEMRVQLKTHLAIEQDIVCPAIKAAEKYGTPRNGLMDLS